MNECNSNFNNFNRNISTSKYEKKSKQTGFDFPKFEGLSFPDFDGKLIDKNNY